MIGVQPAACQDARRNNPDESGKKYIEKQSHFQSKIFRKLAFQGLKSMPVLEVSLKNFNNNFSFLHFNAKSFSFID